MRMAIMIMMILLESKKINRLLDIKIDRRINIEIDREEM